MLTDSSCSCMLDTCMEEKLMRGMVSSEGFEITEKHIASSLHRVAPEAYEAQRNDTHDRLNPKPYIALYHGHKLHIDQNEKLVNFGVVYMSLLEMAIQERLCPSVQCQ